MLSDEIAYTADPQGPVYQPALDSVSDIQAAAGCQQVVRWNSYQDIDYEGACRRAAQDVVHDLRFLPASARSHGPVSPAFEEERQDPDVDLLEELKEIVSRRVSPAPDRHLAPANAVRFVLTRPSVLAELRRSRALDAFLRGEDFLRLSSAVRAMVYRHIATELSASYLPASSRARLLPTNRGAGIAPVADITAAGQLTAATEPISVSAAVDALVKRAGGDPVEILRTAASMKNSYRKIRDTIYPSEHADALLGSFHATSRSGTTRDLLNSIVGAPEERPLLSDCMEVNLVFFVIPVVTLDVTRVRTWLERKVLERRIGAFAHLVWHSQYFSDSKAYLSLYERSGLLRTSARGAGGFDALVCAPGEDGILAARLAEALRDRGLATWTRDANGEPGAALHDVYRRALEACRRVVLIVSRNSLTAEDQSYVLEQALAREAREGGTAVVIPVAADDSIFQDWRQSWLEITRRTDELQSRVIADFRGALESEGAFESAVDQLAAAIRAQ